MQHWDLCVVVRLKDLLLEPAGALVEDGEELPGELLNLVDVRGRVDVGIPRLALWRANIRSGAKRKKKLLVIFIDEGDFRKVAHN